MRAAFENYDAIVSPTLSTVAYPVGIPFDKAYPMYPGAVDLIAPGNLAGLPCLAIPNGIADAGLPSGIAFMGRAFDEAKLAQIGKRYQAASVHHTLRPTLRAAAPT